MEDLLHEWLKQQINAGEKPNNQSFNQPFNSTGSDLDPKTPGILVFDSDNEELSFVLTLDEHGHLISTDVPDERVELQESLKFEDLGIVWLDSQNKIQMTSDEPIVEDFGSEEVIVSFIETVSRGGVYFKTTAGGTRVYFYRGIDGQYHKVTAEQIQQYRQATYEYEMAKVNGEGLPAGGWIPRETYLDGRPSAPTDPGSVVSIIDGDFEGRQAGRTPKNKKDDPKNDPTRGVRKGPDSGIAKEETDGWKSRLRNLERNALSRVVRRDQCPAGPPSDNVTPRDSILYDDKGYLERGAFYTETRPENLQVAQDGSVAAGILEGQLAIYQPVQGGQWEQEGDMPEIAANTIALSPDGNQIAAASGQDVQVWERHAEGRNFVRRQTGLRSAYHSYSIIQSLQFSPNGSYLVVWLEDGSAELRQLDSRLPPQRFEAPVNSITFNAESNLMVVGQGGTVTMWGLNPASNTAAIIQSVQLSGQINQLHISPDGDSLVASNGRDVWIMTIDSNSLNVRTSRYITLGDYSLDNVAFSTGLVMIVGHTANSARIWRSGLHEEFERTPNEYDLDLRTRDTQVRRAFYIPEYDRVAITFENNAMAIWRFYFDPQREPQQYYAQELMTDEGFGEMVNYPGRGNFLVAPGANHIAVRYWSTQ